MNGRFRLLLARANSTSQQPSSHVPYVWRQAVQWGDMDAFAHLNNVIYTRYFESARVHYIRESGWMASGGGLQRYGPILKDISVKYRLPVVFPATISVWTHLHSIAKDRCTMIGVFKHDESDAIVADGSCTVVSYDFELAKPCPLPQNVEQYCVEVERHVPQWVKDRAHKVWGKH